MRTCRGKSAAYIAADLCAIPYIYMYDSEPIYVQSAKK
jgi:hypothetical protein